METETDDPPTWVDPNDMTPEERAQWEREDDVDAAFGLCGIGGGF